MGQRDLEYMIPELGLRKEDLDVVVFEEALVETRSFVPGREDL